MSILWRQVVAPHIFNYMRIVTSQFDRTGTHPMKIFALAAALTMATNVANAGDQYIDGSGYALGGYDPVAYWSLEQSAVGEKQPEAIPGKASITAEYNGAKWAFSSEENRDKFNADPTKWSPQYDGHCAYGVGQGGKVPANPNLWRIIDDKLYVNINPAVVGFFEADLDGNLQAAENGWGALEAAAASDRKWKEMTANDGTYTVTAPLQ